MAAFKHISQIQDLANCQKISKQLFAKVPPEPVPAYFFAKFPFDKKEGPLLLVGDVPNVVLTAVKKLASPPILGTCAAAAGDALAFGGKIKVSQAKAALKNLTISREVTAEEPEEAKEEGSDSVAKEEVAPSKTVVFPGGPTVALKPAQKPASGFGSRPLTAPSRPATVARQSKPSQVAAKGTDTGLKIPKTSERPSAPENPQPSPAFSEKQQFTKRMQAVFPLYQNAIATEGPHVEEIRRLFKRAGELAVDKEFANASDTLAKVEALIARALSPSLDGKADPEAEAVEDEREERQEADGLMKCRKAWQKATRDADAAIKELQGAVLRTGDPRAAGIANGVSRVLKRLPDVAAALEQIEDAARGGKDLEGARKQASALAAQCAQYIRAGGLIAAVRKNPFVPVDLEKIFDPALQLVHRECK